jgi:aspartate/methionine/tyrosine aminotransferase
MYTIGVLVNSRSRREVVRSTCYHDCQRFLSSAICFDSMQPSARMLAVQSPIIPMVGEWIRQCPGTISLGQGVVYYGPPKETLAAAAEFGAATSDHKYALVDGWPTLKETLAHKLLHENAVSLAGRKLIVTAGANLGFFNALVAILDPGDEVILPTPYYFNHEMAVTMLSGRPVTVSTDATHQLDVSAIEAAITPRTKAIVTVSPNNPTGAVYSEESLRAINRLCAARGIYHISDEAYEYFVYGDARHVSPAAFAESTPHTISLYSFSKAYGMASWRLGYIVAPDHLATSIHKGQDTNLICAPVISQRAGCAALADGEAFRRPRLAELARVREFALGELQRVRSLTAVSPAQGAFYIYVIVDTVMDPLTLVERLIREHGIAVLPGTTFGDGDGCTLRISYGPLETQTAPEALSRLTRGLSAIVG